MTLRRIQFCLGAAFLLIAAVVVTAVVHSRHREQKEYWQEVAAGALEQTIEEEMRKRGTANVQSISSGSTKKDSNIKPTTITATNEDGEKTFLITAEQQIHNISNSSIEKVAYSVLLEKDSLNGKTVNHCWNQKLMSSGFDGQTITRISLTDWQGRRTTAYTPDTSLLAKSDSIAVFYLGYRSEVEVTGYIYYPLQATLTPTFIMTTGLICIPLLAFVVLLPVWGRKLRKEKDTIYVPVKEVEQPQASIYRMDKELIFDFHQQQLTWRGEPVKLTPAAAKLLRCFLEAEEYRLSTQQIMKQMWQSDTITRDRMYSSIKRLRAFLPKDSGWDIVNETTAYRLMKKTSTDNSL